MPIGEIVFKKSLMAVGLAAGFVLIPTAASALDCTNVSRPPAACGSVGQSRELVMLSR